MTARAQKMPAARQVLDKAMRESEGERAFETQLAQIAAKTEAYPLTFLGPGAVRRRPPVREFVFHPTRNWRFDFAWPDAKVAVEIEGGTFSASRHTWGTGFEADCIKYAEAAILGWRVLRVTTDMVLDGRAIALLERVLR